jgi:hypothetical protein
MPGWQAVKEVLHYKKGREHNQESHAKPRIPTELRTWLTYPSSDWSLPGRLLTGLKETVKSTRWDLLRPSEFFWPFSMGENKCSQPKCCVLFEKT